MKSAFAVLRKLVPVFLGSANGGLFFSTYPPYPRTTRVPGRPFSDALFVLSLFCLLVFLRLRFYCFCFLSPPKRKQNNNGKDSRKKTRKQKRQVKKISAWSIKRPLYKIVNNLVGVDLSKELIPLTRHSRNSHAKFFRIPYEKKTYLQ